MFLHISPTNKLVLGNALQETYPPRTSTVFIGILSELLSGCV